MSRSNNAQINLRVSDAVAADLDALAEQEHLTRIDVARQILLEGIADRKLRTALRLYRGGKISKSRAAEIAGVTLWEWLDLLEQEQVAGDLTASEAVDEVRRIVAEAMR